ncbi:MAG: M42 family metallopeptidase, partial [Planctomycetota bacterium]
MSLNLDLLKQLCEIHGVPGRERRVREFIEKAIDGLFDEVRLDPMGSLLCVRKSRTGGQNPTKVLMLSHMDEIGFLVSHIDDKGFLRVNPAGGFDTRNLFSRRVTVCAKDADIHGVMNPGGRPIHIASEEDKKKVPEIKEFFIDTGMDADEVKSKVRVGDMVVWDEPFRTMGHKVVSKALDNRYACWVAIEAVRALQNVDHDCELHVAFTVQEEVGLRGAITSSFDIDPDIAI